MASDMDPVIGSNVAQAFRSATDMRRLLAKLRGDLISSEDLKGIAAGNSPFLQSSKVNALRKFTLDEHILIGNNVFYAAFESATIQVHDLRLSVGELISIAFHEGIGKIVESLTIGEHDRLKVVESAAKAKAQDILCTKEWSESLRDVPSITIQWPYEVLLEMIQSSKGNELVTDSILLMWHLHNLTLRKGSLSLRRASEPQFLDHRGNRDQELQQPGLVVVHDEDLLVRISNRRRISRHLFAQSIREAFGHHISGLRASVKRNKINSKVKLQLLPVSTTMGFPDTRSADSFSSERTVGEDTTSFFTRLLQPSLRDRFLKLRKAAEVNQQHHLLRIPQPITPFEVQPSVRAEVSSLLLAPRFLGSNLGVWRLDKDMGLGTGFISNNASRSPKNGSRRNGKDAERPTTADSATSEEEVEVVKPVGMVFADHIEFVDEVFKHRFV